MAGQTLYDSECDSCHRAGSHDTNGPFGDLAGTGSALVNDLGTIDRRMDGLILTDQEIADLAAFLDSL
jgi:mono/diheme cytochrome c family protein